MKRALLLLIGMCLIVQIPLFSMKNQYRFFWGTGRKYMHKNPYNVRNFLTKSKIGSYGKRFYTQSVPAKIGGINWLRNKWGGIKAKQWIPEIAAAGTVGLGMYGYYRLMKPSIDIEIIQDAIQKKDLSTVFGLIEKDPQGFRKAFDGLASYAQADFIKISLISADQNTLKYILSALVKKDTTEKRIGLLRSLSNNPHFKKDVLLDGPGSASIIRDFPSILEKAIKEEAGS